MAKRPRSFQGSSSCSAPASTAWAVWTNPPEWPGDVIERAAIDRDFGVGAKITMKGKGGPTTTATVTRVDPPRMWVGVSKFPGLTITSEHVIDDSDGGTTLTERVTMSGPLSAVAAILIGRRLGESFTATTSHIARLAAAR
jgi:hypothetical protein